MVTKTKTSFYRRIYIAYLIDSGINTIPKLQECIDIPRRTAQDTIGALQEIDIVCLFAGAQKNGHYQIESWGPFSKKWVTENIEVIKKTLDY
ncbi:conserved hypothetical protein [Vibrio nigripulchritudo MADA3029]|uniref:helix-turn-helix domain-containing protein n=1 Tax=Vibrio nigripulchritudo TaxID=28173 RepID=UPI0003B1BE35|nr:helix-turn-helix domain-containing protein [Vibrio nigripulchritudo]CCN50664.1 conserved hypothetical protein [Vibrio nigripulchritudo MADA3020]CCN51869.1 conserved hypothetical protein [Vibrio nigripulchritudo MADA3021]CCN62371.1 conserved hypothetical protein [Vibrio nigripulchritudo MADA3029]